LQIVASAPGYYHPGRSGRLQLGPKNIIAYFGEVHPEVRRVIGLRDSVAAFEVFLGNLPAPRTSGGQARPLLARSPYQAVTRDFAFTLDRDVSAEKVMRAAQDADRKLIESVEVFDVYAGKNIDPGKKSLAISVRMQPTEGTLTDEQIDAVSKAIVQRVGKATGGEQR
jgi:phenylalanyl-tRNA synthetase beta chain